jgi:hypothetical protein
MTTDKEAARHIMREITPHAYFKTAEAVHHSLEVAEDVIHAQSVRAATKGCLIGFAAGFLTATIWVVVFSLL